MREALISRREAAEIGQVSLGSIDKAIEDGVVRVKRTGGRSLLSTQDVALLVLLKEIPVRLPVREKRRIRSWLLGASSSKDLALSPALLVHRGPEIDNAVHAAERYAQLRESYIENNPGIRGGEPVIRGTRVPVRGLARQIELGETPQTLKEDYPQLPPEAFEIAPLWARANPRRGRPSPRTRGVTQAANSSGRRAPRDS